MLDWLLGGNIFETLKSITIILVVGLVVGLAIYAMVKYENARPYVAGIFLLAWFGGGIYSAFTMVNYYTSVRNQTYGEIKEYDPYEDFNFFEYNLTDLTFYQDEEGNYLFSKTYDTTIEFNGSNNTYTLLLNNTPCTSTSASYGRLRGDTVLYFYDFDNTELANINLYITFTFYASNFNIEVNTDATDDNIGLLREYVLCNGFNLRIINSVYGNGGEA